MTDTLAALPPEGPLTSRILLILLRHRIASTSHLHELLAAVDADTGDLEPRLEVLHAQDLTGCHRDGWYLTEEGLAVACALPESLGLRPSQPITGAGPAAARAADALTMTALGLMFRRQHSTDYPGAPFAWDLQVVHRVKDGDGNPAGVRATARLRTCRPPCRRCWRWTPSSTLFRRARRRSRSSTSYRASPEGGGPPGTAPSEPGPWRRWYPRAPHLLLIARTTRSEFGQLLAACRERADADPIVAGLLDRGRLGLAVLADLESRGAAAAVWSTPNGRKGQVWTDLARGTGGGGR